MDARRFAMILGVVFVLIGVLAFVPGVNRPDPVTAPELTIEGPGHGYMFGMFHVNVLHNLVHIVFGVLGILMARDAASAVLYARIVAVAYGLLTVMGAVPGLNTTFGLIPIHGYDVILHALIAIAATYYGFVHRFDVATTTTTTTPPPTTTPT
jgi:hypothetical protein